MILVDTSVWIAYVRGVAATRALADLLESAEAAMHPFVHGELALGHLGRRRTEVLRDLSTLPQIAVIPDDDVLRFIEMHRLAGSGIGWVDVHLVASAVHAHAYLWTLDRRLCRLAERFRVARQPRAGAQ